jgi:hypothetical protein
MKLLRYLAEAFIDTFGITRPASDEQDRATRYIAVLLVALVLLLCATIAFSVHAIHL